MLIASGYWTWRNILLTNEEYTCHCLTQTFLYLKLAILVLVWEAGELFSMGLPDYAQEMSISKFSAMKTVRWLEANAGTNEQEIAVPAPEQLSKVSLSRILDIFNTTCRILWVSEAIEWMWARHRLMPWLRAMINPSR